MPNITYYNGDYKPLSQKLRREMTRQERHLWYDYLKLHPANFRRQKQFGHYIVDFYCASVKLVVELDGSQHFEPGNAEKDHERTAFLEQYGLTVLRIPNNEVNQNFNGVCEYIDRIVAQEMEE